MATISIRPYEKFAEVYDLVTQEEFYFDYFNFIKKIFKTFDFNPPQKILDVACGTGRLAKHFLIYLIPQHYNRHPENV